jgi:hypothetical protein
MNNGFSYAGIFLRKEDKEYNYNYGIVCATIFTWLSFWLLISFIRTFLADPGQTPDYLEWDLVSDEEVDDCN